MTYRTMQLVLHTAFLDTTKKLRISAFILFVGKVWLGLLLGGALLHSALNFQREDIDHYSVPCIPVQENLKNINEHWLIHSSDYSISEETTFLTPYHFGRPLCIICVPSGPKRVLQCLYNPTIIPAGTRKVAPLTVRQLCTVPFAATLAPRVTLRYQELERGLHLGSIQEKSVSNERMAGVLQVGAILLSGQMNCTQGTPIGTAPLPIHRTDL